MSTDKTLTGKVAVVTGASRGAGKGIALALGSAGAAVYVTGRSKQEGDAPLPGTIYATAKEIDAAGGTGIPVACDHADDSQVAALFEQVKADYGYLDILVNNATFIHDELITAAPFWKKSLDMANVLDVGLRSGYVASWYAAPLMVERDHALIVFPSSFGARCYMHGPAYGAQKAGIDKLAYDMAVDLKPENVAAVSIWMGMLKTERSESVVSKDPDKYAGFWEIAESPAFTGHVIAALYNDANLMDKSGQIMIGAELAQEYDILDDNGAQPPSHRDMLGAPAQANPAIVE